MDNPVGTRLSHDAYRLILQYEVGGGRAYYTKHLANPTWPKGESGVTIGIGYDLGYNTAAEITRDWSGTTLTPAQIQALTSVAGLKGQRARAELRRVRVAVPQISWEDAWEVFDNTTVPRFIRLTLATYPQAADKLSANGFGALVSLVFNRGAALTGTNRQEMAAIAHDLHTMPAGPALNNSLASRIRSMKRIWAKTPHRVGLSRRRESEARLILGRPDFLAI